jgi:hypothetical protein
MPAKMEYEDSYAKMFLWDQRSFRQNLALIIFNQFIAAIFRSRNRSLFSLVQDGANKQSLFWQFLRLYVFLHLFLFIWLQFYSKIKLNETRKPFLFAETRVLIIFASSVSYWVSPSGFAGQYGQIELIAIRFVKRLYLLHRRRTWTSKQVPIQIITSAVASQWQAGVTTWKSFKIGSFAIFFIW